MASTSNLKSTDWQVNNEITSQGCSLFADESVEGKLMSELRKKVPIEILTNAELRMKILTEYKKHNK